MQASYRPRARARILAGGVLECRSTGVLRFVGIAPRVRGLGDVEGALRSPDSADVVLVGRASLARPTLSGWQDENLPRRDCTNFVPKGLKDSAWGLNPRCLLKGRPRPEGAAEPVLHVCRDLPNEPLTTNIFRPFRAGRYLNVFPGLKPRAESLSPFGTNSVSRVAILTANTPTLPRSASHNSRTRTTTRTRTISKRP